MRTPQIRILSEPRPVSTPDRRAEDRAPVWRWRYRDPGTGEVVDPSELLTPDEVLVLDPKAEVIPGSRTLQPAPAIRLWR